MLKEYRGDLHIHSCLSPCGEKDMTPKNIIEMAKNKGLNLIGITDHNSCENVSAVLKVGEKLGIKVLGGVEITTEEEVHILGFFDNISQVLKIQEIIYQNLDGENDKDLFGEQLIVDEDDKVVGENKKLLISATKLKLEQVLNLVQEFGGISIASHIDRQTFSIISQLGFIPEDLKLDAVEVSPNYKPQITNYKLQNLPIVSFSDAHKLEDIGKCVTTFFVDDVTINKLKGELNYGRFIITYPGYN